MPKYRQEELEQIHQEYRAGRSLIEAGLLEDAIAHFDSVLGRLPRRRRDRIYRFEGPVLERLPDRVLWLPTIFREALLAKVYCLNELGRFSDAYTLLERAVELDPDNPQVYAEIGFAHGAQDNLALARVAYAHAATLEPHNPSHLRALAHIALLGEDFEEAQTQALRALQVEPDSVLSLHQLAYAKYRLGEIEEAIRILERAVTIMPDDRESILRLTGTLREVGRFREAITRLERYLQVQEADPEILGMMTDLLQQDGTAPELFAHAERLLERNPRDPSALDLLAWGYYQHGETQKAYDVLQRLMRLEPMQAHHHFKLGMIHESLGRLPLAMASFLRASALDDTGEISQMANEAMATLDQVQLELILSRAESDPRFRQHVQRAPEQALLQAGYLLSPLGFQMLQSFDFARGIGLADNLPPQTIH